MLHHYAFRNAAEFQALFGLQTHGNGAVSRKNKILLTMLKDKQVRQKAPHLLSCGSMPHLMSAIKRELSFSWPHYFTLMGYKFIKSSIYALDEFNGICQDGSDDYVRYNLVSNGKVYKMKASKFFMRLINEQPCLQFMPQAVKTWLTEELALQWRSYSAKHRYELNVDYDFARIYDSDNYAEGDFHSCMTDQGYHTMYEKLDCKAASLVNGAGEIAARCILYHCKVEATGEWLWVAERQYSADCELHLQQMLVDKLVEAGEIQAYKKVGAGCGDANSFVRVNGEPLEAVLSIECNLGYGDTVSYQDSFKWYDMNEGKAYNRNRDLSVKLDTTEGRIDAEYDEIHDCHCMRTVEVYYHGRSYQCDADNLDEFILIDGEYYHCEDCYKCSVCGEYFLEENGHYHEEFPDDYCCSEECLDQLFEDNDYVKVDGNWEHEEDCVFSDFQAKYILKEDAIAVVFVGLRSVRVDYCDTPKFKFGNGRNSRVCCICGKPVIVEDCISFYEAECLLKKHGIL